MVSPFLAIMVMTSVIRMYFSSSELEIII